MDTIKGDLDDMKTLSACCRMLDKIGFTAQFKINETGIESLNTKKQYNPADVKIVNFYRFEGASNPDDNSILYAIETAAGERGTITDAYGPNGDPLISDFIKQVEQFEKKTDKDKNL